MKDDTISRQAVLDAVEGVDWYHQNKNGEMVHGANSDNHQAWYKADDIYKAIESVPSAQLAQDLPKGCTDTISRQAAIDALEKVADMFPWRVPGNRDTYDRYNEAWNDAIGRAEMEIENMPSAQPGWIPCTPETMPPDYQWYYATCKSLVDNRENWVVEGCYTPWEHFDSTPMIKCGEAEVIAWMPKEFPEPWEGGQE